MEDWRLVAEPRCITLSRLLARQHAA